MTEPRFMPQKGSLIVLISLDEDGHETDTGYRFIVADVRPGDMPNSETLAVIADPTNPECAPRSRDGA